MNNTVQGLTEDVVSEYLKVHPEFFQHHEELLIDLKIPHPSGAAVSLVSRQLEILRDKHQNLENQLSALIDIARDNDTAMQRMHQLALALLEARTLEQLHEHLQYVLLEYFGTDFVALKIRGEYPECPLSELFLSEHDLRWEQLLPILERNQPKCGRPTLAQARLLFADNAMAVHSCAIIPMAYAKLEGVLAIGSREEGRFHHSMGHLFLEHMSQLIATRLIALLN
ncbi:MAG: DUF484 family protein [Methylococcales bacterium]|nr:DUF484 family protein [Methylococcales bacterium]